MNEVTAGQLVYTNVEADQSPHGLGGFQILLQTPGLLNEAEQAEIPFRLRLGELKSKKHIFYLSRGGNCIVAQIVPLPEPDAAGRGGRYFAHALLLPSHAFAQIKNDPFHIFHQFRFMESVTEALTAGALQTGHLAPTVLDVDYTDKDEVKKDRLEILASLKADQLGHLLNLVLRLARQPESRMGLGLYGTAEQAFNLLSGVFALIPASLRVQCSFDTQSRDDLHQAPLWSRGLSVQSLRSPALYAFELESGVFSPLPKTISASPLAQWILQSFLHDKPIKLLEQCVSQAFVIDRWISGDSVNTDEILETSGSIFKELIAEQEHVLDDILKNSLRSQVGALGDLLSSTAISWARNQGNDVMLYCLKGYPNNKIMDWVHELCLQSADSLSIEDWENIEQFFVQTGSTLQFLKCLKTAKQWERLRSVLARCPDEIFYQFSKESLGNLGEVVVWTALFDAGSLFFGLRVPGEDPVVSDSEMLIATLLGLAFNTADANESPLGSGFYKHLFGGRRGVVEPDKKFYDATVIPHRWLYVVGHLSRHNTCKSKGG